MTPILIGAWRSDGTKDGTTALEPDKYAAPGYFITFSDRVYIISGGEVYGVDAANSVTQVKSGDNEVAGANNLVVVGDYLVAVTTKGLYRLKKDDNLNQAKPVT